jgi:hypothetical protein
LVDERVVSATQGCWTHEQPTEPGHRLEPQFASSIATKRDPRIDLFRGLALWWIFLDHIPGNIANWITIRNYGFSDAAEIFIFISGYTAALVYGRTMRDDGFPAAAAQILKRTWQVYVAHVFLFALYVAGSCMSLRPMTLQSSPKRRR